MRNHYYIEYLYRKDGVGYWGVFDWQGAKVPIDIYPSEQDAFDNCVKRNNEPKQDQMNTDQKILDRLNAITKTTTALFEEFKAQKKILNQRIQDLQRENSALQVTIQKMKR